MEICFASFFFPSNLLPFISSCLLFLPFSFLSLSFPVSFISSFLYSISFSFFSFPSLPSFVVVFTGDLLSCLRGSPLIKNSADLQIACSKRGKKKKRSLLPLSHADGIALTTLRIHVRIPNCCRVGVVSTCFPSSSLSLLALRPVMSWFWFSPPATGMFFIPSPSSIPPLAFCKAARPLFSSPLSSSRTFQVFFYSSTTFFLFDSHPINRLASFLRYSRGCCLHQPPLPRIPTSEV